jgi:hypothetical protein
MNIWLLRRLLTWYGFPDAQDRLMKFAYGIIAANTLFFALAILVGMTVILLRLKQLWAWGNILAILFGVVVGGAGALWFFSLHRKYAQRCPACGSIVPEFYHLGKHCEVCDTLLHSWLVAEYDV